MNRIAARGDRPIAPDAAIKRAEFTAAAVLRRRQDAGEGSFEPTLTVTTQDLGDAVEIRVRDNGVGIPADIRDKLFQPFFTTKPTGEGTGLGLSISNDIITHEHGGAICVASEVGAFTEFTVWLPRRFAAGRAQTLAQAVEKP
jgi:signal transduction histidine kinase